VDLDDIYVVTDRLETASAADVTQAEHQLGCRFPTGYAEYVQRLGRGSLNDLVRVMLPGRIVAELRDWRATWLWTESWFWTILSRPSTRTASWAPCPLATPRLEINFGFIPMTPTP
jgi:hypothetical protein